MKNHPNPTETMALRNARCRGLAALVFAALACAAPALAQMPPVTNTYGPSWHKFKFTTSNTVPMQVKFGRRASVLARTNTCQPPRIKTPWIEHGPLGIGPVGPLGPKVFAGPAWAEGLSRCNVLALAPGLVEAEYAVNGTAHADHNGCHPPGAPPPWGSSYAEAWSAANMAVRGGKLDRSGNVKFSGGWRWGTPVTGSTWARVGTDPLRARLIDQTTGITQEFLFVSFSAMVVGGEVAWESGVLSNTGGEMLIDLKVPGVRTTQSGHLRLRVAGGVVTERILTGMFTDIPVPPLGGAGMFSVALPELSLDYDLGGDPAHNLTPEFIFESGGESNAAVECYVIPNGSLITDIGTGPNGDNLSRIPEGDNVFGFKTSAGITHIADDFTLFGGGNWLTAVHWPIYQINAPAEAPITAAYARIWSGTPGAGGVPVAGDMVTNRLVEFRYADYYRVSSTPTTNTRAVKDLVIDLSGMGPLPSGTYWIEVAVQGPSAYGDSWTPPSIWPRAADNALLHSVGSGAWTPMKDTLSARNTDVPFLLFVGDHPPPLCYPDCNGSDSLTVADFGCFQTRFIQNDPYADCSQDGAFTVADFGCFQTKFVAGCP